MPKKGETKAPEGGKKAGTKKPPVESKEEIKKEETGKAVELVKEIVVQQPEQVVTTVEELKLDRPKIELLKRTIAKGATDDELLMFINVCKGMGLSPFLKHVHLVKRWDSKIGANVAIVQVGIDGFRSIAEGTGAYAGNDDPKFEGETELEFDTGKQTGKYTAPNQATVIVRKVVQGSPYEFTATARWAEFYPGDKMGFMWRSKPHVMLGKCAEAQALRKAFPKVLGGVYVPEEVQSSVSKKTSEEEANDKFEQAKKAISNDTDVVRVNEFLGKVQKSTKYSDEQKAEMKKIVEARIKELTDDGNDS